MSLKYLHCIEIAVVISNSARKIHACTILNMFFRKPLTCTALLWFINDFKFFIEILFQPNPGTSLQDISLILFNIAKLFGVLQSSEKIPWFHFSIQGNLKLYREITVHINAFKLHKWFLTVRQSDWLAPGWVWSWQMQICSPSDSPPMPMSWRPQCKVRKISIHRLPSVKKIFGMVHCQKWLGIRYLFAVLRIRMKPSMAKFGRSVSCS